MGVCDHVHVLDFGGCIASGTPAEVRADPARGRRLPRRPSAVVSGDDVAPRASTAACTAGYDGVPSCTTSTSRWRPARWSRCSGANGAGKTTTLLTISGLVPALGGTDAGRSATSRTERRRVRPPACGSLARGGLAHVPEDRGLFFDLTVAENLRLGRRARRRRGRRSTEVARVVPGARAAARPQGRPAVGRRAADARAAPGPSIGRPRLLLVDEMSLGPGADHRRAAAPGPAPRSPTRPAPASSWSSSTSRSRSRSPTAPRSSARAASPSPAPARSSSPAPTSSKPATSATDGPPNSDTCLLASTA